MLEEAIRLDPESFIPINAQLGEQIKRLIAQGTLEPGEQLPSVRDLAARLGVNRNTLGKVIEDLERQGYLRTRRGKGVYVVDHPPGETGADLGPFLAETLAAAQARGLDLQALIVALAARAQQGFGGAEAAPAQPAARVPLRRVSEAEQPRVLLVECNQPQLDQFRDDLLEALPVQVDTVLIDDLKRWLVHPDDPGGLRLADYRAAVTTFYHHQEVSSLLTRSGLRVAPVLAEVHPGTLRRLAALPPGTVVGVTCVNWSGAGNLRAALENAGLRQLQIIQGCTTVPQSLKAVFDRARVVLSSGIAAADLEAYREEHGLRNVDLWVEDRRLDPRGLAELAGELNLPLWD